MFVQFVFLCSIDRNQFPILLAEHKQDSNSPVRSSGDPDSHQSKYRFLISSLQDLFVNVFKVKNTELQVSCEFRPWQGVKWTIFSWTNAVLLFCCDPTRARIWTIQINSLRRLLFLFSLRYPPSRNHVSLLLKVKLRAPFACLV